MEYIINILNYEVFQNQIFQIIIAIIVFFIVYFVLKYLMIFLTKKINQNSNWKKDKFSTVLINLIHSTPKYFFLVLEIYIPLKLLKLPSIVDQAINILFTIVIILQIIRIINIIIWYFLWSVFKQNWNIEETTQKIIKITVKIIVRAIWILFLMSNIWIEITPIIASLWVWGIAIAFALQHMLEDVFASLSILFSKPFKVWDWISVWNNSWTVTNVTLKSTHMLSISWHETIVPNREILSTPLNSYGKMEYRRKKFTIDVVYETSVKKLKSIEDIIKKIIEKQDGIVFEYVRMKDLWSYSIIFETSYKLENPAFQNYLDTHHNIIFELLEIFEKEWIAFAYPTQVVYKADIK